ncbi:phosphoglycolate phosphatase [Xanthobacter sp. V4C-4]|uniref:phosphoglycolate phosphatase n=1 Tax=Xanthobacter cornucopiae TaxID=3119924 RepID=UPI00372B8290
MIAFDLDGTLVDTAPDLLNTLDQVLAGHGLPPVDRTAARNMIGGGARVLIQRALDSAGVPVSDTDLAELNQRFLAHYAAHIADESRPFPGLLPALDRLADTGARLCVCTNKLEHLARSLLDALDLTSRFAVVTGGDTYEKPKPDPLPLTATIAAAGGALGSAIMVGDSITDIRAARATGVPVIAVSFGYTETPAGELGADALIHHFDELTRAVEALLAQAPA